MNRYGFVSSCSGLPTDNNNNNYYYYIVKANKGSICEHHAHKKKEESKIAKFFLKKWVKAITPSYLLLISALLFFPSLGLDLL